MSKSPSQREAFRGALETAKGVSAHVIIVFADIRDFSRFSRANDPTDVATYVSRIYLRLMDLFPLADFYKAAGDGLLITIPYEDILGDDSELKAKAQSVVEACLTCVETFRDFCSGDPMVNFEVPHQIGFGVTRGSACCIMSEGRILDYSGHRLNLAARLMDLARPEGVILDKSFGLELLDASTAKLFSEELIYVRSLAEDKPTRVYAQESHVRLPESSRQPISEGNWKVVSTTQTVAQWKAWSMESYGAKIPAALKDGTSVSAVLSYDDPVNSSFEQHVLIKNAAYSRVGPQHMIFVPQKEIVKLVKDLVDDTLVRVDVNYACD